jgi:hypothetical protein
MSARLPFDKFNATLSISIPLELSPKMLALRIASDTKRTTVYAQMVRHRKTRGSQSRWRMSAA